MPNEEISGDTADNNKKEEEIISETNQIEKNRKSSKKRGSSLLRGVLIVLIIILGAWLVGGMPRLSKILPFGQKSPSPAKELNLGSGPNAQPLQVPKSAQAEEDAVTQVVDKSSPAVVSIIITKDVPKLQNFYFDPFGDGSGGGSSLFDQFFGQNQQPPQQPGSAPNQPVPGSGGTVKQEIGGGSGFVVSPDGLIVTNKHVVVDTTADYTVLTNDGREYSAKVLGRDRTNDVAVIKVDPNSPNKGKGVNQMDTLPLGDSGQLKIGQTVIAIGNALGEFTNTVSKGIVSGLRRNIVAGGFSGAEQLDQLIQTDAAINEGNSGGPLLNLKGEVVGINVAIAQGAQNIGFALPIDTVKNTIESVQKSGKIIQPYLGVRYVVINPVLKQQNNLPFDYGVLVARGQNPGDMAVLPGSPADKAGITENDIILEINSTKIDENNSLAQVVSSLQVGQEITLKVWSKGDTKTIKVVLQEAPGN
jgi:S1-C subfamily serine protease